ncbi:unnamed protein product [Vicia faba]|uniref:XPG-I domain-containing protein n=1 Tax=Vicia faba TaxID=3906 RepID=A0AAV1A4U6_VICFA|nr:unnamed protein product [Vicia faba]
MENLNLALVSSPKPLLLGHSSSKNVFTRRKPFAFGTFRVSANSSSSHVTRAASKSHQNLKSGSESPSSSFGLQLVSSMASFCCSCPSESMPVLMLLTECLKYLPHETSEDYRKLVFVVEHMVEAYIVVLKSLAGEKLLIAEVQLHAVEFLGTVLSLLTCLQWHSGGYEPIIELSRRLCSVQKDLGLQWEPDYDAKPSFTQILVISSIGLIFFIALRYHLKKIRDQKIIPRLRLSRAGHPPKLERFSHYVARQMGFKDRRIEVIAFIDIISIWWQVIGGAVIVIMLPLVALTTQSASYVFTNFELAPNTTGISSKPYAVILSFLVSQYSLYGYDAAAHLTEETKGADKNGPIAILGSLAIISVFGWAYILALTFSIQDFAYLYDPNNETAGAFVPAQILYDAFHGRYHNSAGAIVLLFIIWGSFFFGGLSITTSAARVVYALSRDKGVPFSFLWRKLHPKHKVPTNAVWLCAAICILLGLPILKVNVVFTAITSICTIGWVGGYAVPIFARMVMPEKNFKAGPFYLGKARRPICYIAIHTMIEEAEAQCALLNSESLCDGCFSSDSDIFLFGARTVYREICLDGYILPCIAERDLRRFANLRSTSSELGLNLPLHEGLESPADGRRSSESSYRIGDNGTSGGTN